MQYHIELEKAHYEQLYHFVQNAINTVTSEQMLPNGKSTDHIYASILEGERRRTMVVCTICGEENARRKINCTQCKKRNGLRLARSAVPAANQDLTEPTLLKEMTPEVQKCI